MIVKIDDDTTVYPDDVLPDDPAVMEMEPARPQRDLDLEALNLQRRGFSIRQIAKLQKVHPNTAFQRVRRGKEIAAREPLQAEGTTLHAELCTLQRIEDGLVASAVAGDLRASGMYLRIFDRRWRLGQFAREAERTAKKRGSTPADGGRSGEPAVSLADRDPDEVWELLSEILPQRAADISQIKTEFMEAVARRVAAMEDQKPTRSDPAGPAATDLQTDDRKSDPTASGQATPIAVPPPVGPPLPSPANPELVPVADAESAWLEPTLLATGSCPPLRPPTRRERAMKARARRERRANRARAQQLQSASATVTMH